MKETKGISLVVLVITIIVMIIIAGAIIISLSNTNIIDQAEKASNDYTIAQEKEKIGLALSEWQIEKYVGEKSIKETIKYSLEGTATVLGNDHGPLTVIFNKTENAYTVTKDGTVLVREDSLLEKYILGSNLVGRPITDIFNLDDSTFKDDEKTVDKDETQTIGANFVASTLASNELKIIYFESQGIIYKIGFNVNSYLTDKEYGVVDIYEPEEGSRVGKYVEDENGATWRIIYDDDIHGLQMISTNTFKYNGSNFYLGYYNTLITDWTSINSVSSEFGLADLNGNKSLDDNLEKSIYSYNQAIETLNTACENLFKENGVYTKTYIQDVRSAGSNPVFANKNSENATVTTSANFPLLETLPKNNVSQAAGIVNGKGYGTDNNFETDFDRMVALGINASDTGYWLASRVVIAASNDVQFGVRYVYGGNTCIGYNLWGVRETGTFDNNGYIALRPVVSLKSSIKFVEETDGSEGNPYKFN